MALISAELLEILRCPVDMHELTEDVEASRLRCGGCGRAYPVKDGIPIMLVEEAELE